MSVVLQSLVHNPFVRDYFLSDAHTRKLCPIANKDDGRAVCIGCELDDIVQLTFSGDTVPTVPHRFLYSMWQHAENLAGYEQQDAHEFYISVLDGLHSACAAMSAAATAATTAASVSLTSSSPVTGGSSDCTSPARHVAHTPNNSCACLVHRAFAGELRSDLTCVSCGNTSTAVDPILDVSLDLKRSVLMSPLAGAVSFGGGTLNASAANASFTDAGAHDMLMISLPDPAELLMSQDDMHVSASLPPSMCLVSLHSNACAFSCSCSLVLTFVCAFCQLPSVPTVPRRIWSRSNRSFFLPLMNVSSMHRQVWIAARHRPSSPRRPITTCLQLGAASMHRPRRSCFPRSPAATAVTATWSHHYLQRPRPARVGRVPRVSCSHRAHLCTRWTSACRGVCVIFTALILRVLSVFTNFASHMHGAGSHVPKN